MKKKKGGTTVSTRKFRTAGARIQGSESLIVPEAGHSTYWEQPELFNRAVLNFLGKH